jgi:uncharacterized damage-inducible protein DinB
MRYLAILFLIATTVHGQKPDPLEGLWKGYDGEWVHCSHQLVELADAIPADKYEWRPAHGVRSTSEVFMHIAIANFSLLYVTGRPLPPGLNQQSETTINDKAHVIEWLKRSLDAVKEAHLHVTPADLARHVTIANRDVTVEGIYLRILVHANEHMGQLVAYARVNGITPPWSEPPKK